MLGTISSAGGNISITGTGAGTGEANDGIGLFNTTVSTTGAGSISLTGTGGASTRFNKGILLSAATLESTSNASTAGITLTGTGGAGSSGSGGNHGVDLASGARITSVAGDIGITGQGLGAGSGNLGIRMSGASSVQSTGSAKITLTGSAGAGSDSNAGIQLGDGLGSGSITSSGTGTISVTGSGNGTSVFGDGVTIGPSSAITSVAGNISISGSGAPLAPQSPGVRIFGKVESTGAAAISIGGTAQGSNPAILTASGASIGGSSMTGNIALVGDSMSLSGTTQTTGAGTITVRPNVSNRDIQIGAGASDASALGLTGAELLTFNGENGLIIGSLAGGVSGNVTVVGAAATTNITGGTVELRTAGGNIAVNAPLTTVGSLTATAGGDITIAAGQALARTGTGAATTRLNAGGNIEVNDASIAQTTNLGAGDTLDIVINSDFDGSGSGAIRIGTNGGAATTLSTNGGSIVLGGGNVDPALNPARAVSGFSSETGVLISDTVLSSGGGAISIRGQGVNAGVSRGVIIQLGSDVNAAGGSITIAGTGGAGGGSSDNYGVSIGGGALTQVRTSGTGSIAIDGTGGTIGNDSHGVLIGATAVSTDSGAITVTGTASSGTSHGVRLSGANTSVTSTSGDIAITGTGSGGGALGAGVGFNSNSVNGNFSPGGTVVIGNTTGSVSVTANGGSNIEVGNAAAATIATTGSGAISLTADKMNVASGINAGGTVTLRPGTAGTKIDLGSAVDTTASTLELSNAELNQVTAGTLVVGRNDGANAAGAITVSSGIAPANAPNLTLLTGASAAINANVTTTGSLTVNAGTDVAMASGVTIDRTGTGAATLRFNAGSDIVVNQGASIAQATNLGAADTLDIVFNSDSDANGTGRIHLAGAAGAGNGVTFTTNGGNIALGGRDTTFIGAVGGAATYASGANVGVGIGVFLQNATLDAGAGSIAISGQGGEIAGGGNSGVVLSASTLTSGGMTITGQGGGFTGGGGGGNNYGVLLMGSSSLSVGDNALTVTGTGGVAGFTSSEVGVRMEGGLLQSTGAGAIDVTGTGGNGSRGIELVGDAAIQATGTGSITITGTGIGLAPVGVFTTSTTTIGDPAGSGDILIRSLGASGITLDGAVSNDGSAGATVTLNAVGGGTISQAGGGRIVTEGLRILGAGSTTLGGAANDVTTLAADVAGPLALTNSSALTVTALTTNDGVSSSTTTGVTTNGGALAITNTGALDVNAPVNTTPATLGADGGSVMLVSSAAITSDANGTITTTGADGTAGAGGKGGDVLIRSTGAGAITLNAAINADGGGAVPGQTPGSGGVVTVINEAGAIVLDTISARAGAGDPGASAGSIQLRSVGGDITQNASTALTAANLKVISDSSVELLNENNDVNVLAVQLTGADKAFSFRDGNDLTIGSIATNLSPLGGAPANLPAVSGIITTPTAAASNASSVYVQAFGSITVSNEINTSGSAAAPGSTDTAGRGGDVTLYTTGTGGGASIAQNAPIVARGGAASTPDETAGDGGIVTIVNTDSGAVTLHTIDARAGDDAGVATPGFAGAIQLGASGDITQASGSALSAGSLLVTGSTATLMNAGNAISTLAAFMSGDLSVNSTLDLTVETLSPAGSVMTAVMPFDVNGITTFGGNVTLATGGSLTINEAITTTPLSGNQAGGSVILEAAGRITLDGATAFGAITTTGSGSGAGGEVFIHRRAGGGSNDIELLGPITATGGDTGAGGVVTVLNSDGNIYVEGTIDISRGASAAPATNDGAIQLQAAGSIDASGFITGNGGFFLGDATGTLIARTTNTTGDGYIYLPGGFCGCLSSNALATVAFETRTANGDGSVFYADGTSVTIGTIAAAGTLTAPSTTSAASVAGFSGIKTVAGGLDGFVQVTAGDVEGVSGPLRSLTIDAPVVTTPAAGSGLAGGIVALEATGDVTSTSAGTVTANGASSTTGAGGDGGEVLVHSAGDGTAVITSITLGAKIEASGGTGAAGSGGAASSDGGLGGVVTVLNDSGTVSIHDITARGGAPGANGGGGVGLAGAGGWIQLAGTHGITQQPGTVLQGGSLLVMSGESAVLENSGNSVDTVAALVLPIFDQTSPGHFSFNNAGALTIGSIGGEGFFSFLLPAPGAPGIVTDGGNVTVTAGGALTIDGPISTTPFDLGPNAGNVSLTAPTITSTANGTITTAGGFGGFAADGADGGTGGAGGAVLLRATGAGVLTLGAAIDASGGPGGFGGDQNAEPAPGAGGAGGPGGLVTLLNDNGAIVTNDILVLGGPGGLGGLGNGGPDGASGAPGARGTIQLSATAGITQAGTTTLQAGSLKVIAGSTVVLTNSNDVETLAGTVSSGDFSYVNANALTIGTIGAIDAIPGVGPTIPEVVGITTADNPAGNSGSITLGTLNGDVVVLSPVTTGNATLANTAGIDTVRSGSITVTAGTDGAIRGTGVLTTGNATVTSGALTDLAQAGNITLSANKVSADGGTAPFAVTLGTPDAGAGTSTPGQLIVTTDGIGADGGIHITSAAPLTTGAVAATGAGAPIDISTTGASPLTVAGAMSTNDGDIVLTASDISVTGTVDSGSGNVTLRPSTAAATIGVEDASQGFNFTNATLDRITSGTIVIGASDNTGGISIAVDNDVLQGAKNFGFTTAGNIAIGNRNFTTTGNVSFTASNSGGTASITTGSGVISANMLTALANQGIALNTSVNALSATNDGASGNINILEANGVNVVALQQTNAANTTGTVTLTSSTGDIGLNEVSVASQGGLVTITATTGAITDGDGGTAVTIFGSGPVRLEAATGIGTFADAIDTSIESLSASNTTSGDIVIQNSAKPLTLTGVSNTATNGSIAISNFSFAITTTGATTTAADGNISLTADGSLTPDATPLTIDAAVTAGGSGAVALTANGAASDVLVNELVSSASGPITITAGRAITEGGTSGNASLRTTGLLTTQSNAGQALGFANEVGSFNATNNGAAASGDIVLYNRGMPLTITGITNTSPNGVVEVTNESFSGVVSASITTTGPIVSNGDVTLVALGTISDITIQNGVTAANAAATLMLQADRGVAVGDSLTANTIGITAGSGSITGAGLVSGVNVTLDSATGVGTNVAPINTSAGTLAARSRVSGGVFVNETDAVTLDTIGSVANGTAADAAYDVTAGGSITLGGDIGTGAGPVTLAATGSGNIVGGNGVIATTGAVTLSGASVGTSTAPILLDLGGSGTVSATSRGASSAGEIALSDSANAGLDTLNVTVATAAGTAETITIVQTGGGLTVGGDIGNPTDVVFLTANAGKITEGAGVVRGAAVLLTGAAGIGTDGARRVKTAAGTLQAQAFGGGGIFLSEEDAVELNQSGFGNGAVGAHAYDLLAGGTITVSAPVNTFLPYASEGNTTLRAAGGNIVIGADVGSGTGNTVLTSDAGNITGAGLVNGAAVTLDSATGVGTNAVPINTTATTLAARSRASGGVFVNETDAVTLNTIGGVANGAAGAAYDVTAGGSITTSGAITTTGAGPITLTATGANSDILLGNDVNAGTGTLTLTANGARALINQTGGALTAGTLTGSTTTTATLNQAANAITNLGAFTTGSGFTLNDVGGLTVTGAVAGGTGLASIMTSGPLEVNGSVTGTGVALVASGASSDISLAGDANAGSGTLTLDAGRAIGQGAGSVLTAGTLTGMAGTSAVLDRSNVITNLGSFTTNGNFTLNDATGGLALTGAVNAGSGAVAITTAGGALALGTNNVTGQGVSLAGTGVTQSPGSAVNAGAGTLLVDGNDGAIGLAGTLTTTNGAANAVRIVDATTVALPDINAPAGTVTLGGAAGDNLSGAVTQTAGTLIDANTITGNTASAVALGNGTNALGNLGSFTSNGNFTLNDSTGGLTLTGNVAAGPGAVNITTAGGVLALQSNNVSGVGGVTLQGAGVTSTGGTISTRAADNSGIASGAVQITATGTGAIDLAGAVVSRGADSNTGTASAGGNVTLTTNDGAITVSSVVTRGGDGTAGDVSGGNAGTIAFDVGGANTLTLNGDVATRGGDAAGAGTAGSATSLNFAAPTRVAGNVTILSRRGTGTGGAAAGNVMFAGTLESAPLAGGLTVTTDGATTFGGAVGGNGNPLTSLTTDATGTTVMNGGTVTTTGPQTYNDPVTLGAHTVLTSSGTGAAGNITFASTVGSPSTRRLTVNTAGTTTFGGRVGDLPTLSMLLELTTDAAGTTAINGGEVFTMGTQTYNDPVTLGADTSFSIGAPPLPGFTDVTFGSTLESAGAPRNVFVGGGSTLTLGGAVGGNGNPLASFTSQAEITAINGGRVVTTLTQDYYQAVALGANTVFTSSGASSAGNITFRSSLQSPGTPYSLSVNTAGTTTFRTVGTNGDALASVMTDAPGSTMINAGVVTMGTQTYNDPVRLGQPVSLLSFGAGAGGDITFASTVQSPGTPSNLLVTTAGTTRFLGAVGGAGNPLATLTTDAPGATLIGGGSVTTTGSQTYNDALTLGADTIFTSTAGGNLFFGGGLNGPFALTANASGFTTFAFLVGDTAPLMSLATDAAGSTSLNASIKSSGPQTYNDPVALGGVGPTLTSTGGGALTFASTLEGPGELVAVTTGVTTFGGTVGGGGNRLAAVVIGGPAAINGGAVTTNGGQSYGGAVELGADTTLTAGAAIRFMDTLNGPFALNVNTPGSSIFTGVVGGTAPLASLTTDAPGSTMLFTPAITTTGAQTFNDAVELIAPNTMLTSTGNAPIAFNDTLDGSSNLTVTTAGLTSFNGAVGGGGSVLLSLTTDAPGSTAINGGAVTTTGGQAFNDAVTLGAATTTLAAGGPVTFSGAVDGASNLIVTTPGITTFLGAVGGGAPLLSLTTDAGGSTAINGGSVTTTGAQTYNDPVTLGANTTLTGTTPTFGSTVAGMGFDLTLNFSGTTTVDSAGFTGIRSLATGNGGTTQLAGTIVTSGSQTYGEAVALGTDTTLTSTGGGAIAFNGTLNGAQALTVNTSGTTTFGGIVGGTTALTSITTNAAGTTAINATGITTTGAQTYNDPVTLGAHTTLTGTTPTFGSTLAGAGFDLTLNFSGVTTLDGANFTGIRNLATGNGGTTQLTGPITTTGTQTYNDNVSLIGNTMLAAGANAVTFAGTVDADNNATADRSLGIAAGSATFSGNIGAAANGALADLDITATTINFNAPVVNVNDPNAPGQQTVTLNGPVVLGANVAVTTDRVAGLDNRVTFAGDINADAAANNRTLNVNAGTSTVVFSGNIGNLQKLAGLTVTSGPNTTIFNGAAPQSIDASAGAAGDGVVFNGPVQLQQNLAINTAGANAKNVVFKAVLNGDPAGRTLTVTAGGGNLSLEGVGAGQELRGLAVSANTVMLNGNIALDGGGAFNFQNVTAVRLAPEVTIDTDRTGATSAGGAILFNPQTRIDAAGTQALLTLDTMADGGGATGIIVMGILGPGVRVIVVGDVASATPSPASTTPSFDSPLRFVLRELAVIEDVVDVTVGDELEEDQRRRQRRAAAAPRTAGAMATPLPSCTPKSANSLSCD